VRRQLNPNDARATELYPTDLARDNVARLHAHWASLMRKAFGSHVPDLDETLTVLRRADAGIRRHNLSMGAD
jgi:hypothetical protein